MLSNFIFHFIFAIFAIWAAIAWFILQNRLSSVRNALLPLLCLNKIEFPKHRSLFIRAIKSLEAELYIEFQTKISVICPISNEISYYSSIFHVFCISFYKFKNEEFKNIIYKNQPFTLNEFNNKIIKTQKHKKINFLLRLENENHYFWEAEIQNV